MDSHSSRQQEELFTEQVSAGKRKYYFDVKSTKGGDKFITITESRKLFDNNNGSFSYEKNKIFLYPEDFDKFENALKNVLEYVKTGVMPERSVADHHSIDDDDRLNNIDFNF